ncbi:MAG: molybdopterin molybdotransferase MoeA [Nitrospinae bacterium]|nr:molybdopterin molybdotransferase MoeA [Nitrospinota bacterium]
MDKLVCPCICGRVKGYFQRGKMIDIVKAKEIIDRESEGLCEMDEVSIVDSLSCVLFHDIYATTDLPPYDRSAMDGYAVRSEDIEKASEEMPIILNIIDMVQTGKVSEKEVGNREAIKIMTGGKIPAGADTVVMKEFTEEEGDIVKVYKGVAKGRNICYRGEDIKEGGIVFKKGFKVTPAVIALCASLGISRLRVYRKPKVAILTIGDELLDIDEELKDGKIRDSNKYALISQLNECGIYPIILERAEDRFEDIYKKVNEGLNSDFLLTSGGVSVGDFDFVKKVFKEVGIKIFFDKVAIKPGKPTVFGKKDKTIVFGLPGNPVATMITFYEFVRPVIMRFMGREDLCLKETEAILDEDITVEPGRMKILRVKTIKRDNQIFVSIPPTHQGSANLLSLALSDALLKIPGDKSEIKKGTKVKIQLL